jgi:hypothetical protein
VKHGTHGGYKNDRCRCDPCRAAHNADARRRRAERYAQRIRVGTVLMAPLPDALHGRVTVYANWGCRCRPCTDAATESSQRSRRVHQGRTS